MSVLVMKATVEMELHALVSLLRCGLPVISLP